ncbi:MAG: xylulokinase [Verrucomicrobiae bacterium]|nr:xylulokinase [Verrucomicrobiae bacterium]
MSYFLGIDSGTQSTKAIVVRARDGKVVGAASKSYGLLQGLPPGHKEQHPRAWVAALAASVRDALRDAGISSEKILALGVSGQQHGFVPLDAAGRVIRPAKLWCDTSTAPQCAILLKKLGGLAGAVRKIGNSVPPGFTASKILWLKQHEPKNFAQLTTVLLPHDYLNFWLTGEKSMEPGDASGTALMDVRARRWHSEAIRAIDDGLAEKLPEIRPSSASAGRLRPEAARALGLPASVLVSAGGGDNMMGAIGTGNTRPGIVTASFGTSGTIYAWSAKPVTDPRGEIAAFCDSTGAWLPLLCTMNVTVATEMVRRAFGWDYAERDRRAASVAPGAGGLILVPYLEGERTPNVPDGTGVFFGANARAFSPAALLRAAMEGVTLGMNYGLNRLRALGILPRQIRVTGGGAQSPVWRQVMADVFDCEVIGMKTAEGAAYGAALQAWWCHDLAKGRSTRIADLTDRFVKTDPRTAAAPRAEAVRRYRDLQAIQDRAAKDLAEMFKAHRALRWT